MVKPSLWFSSCKHEEHANLLLVALGETAFPGHTALLCTYRFCTLFLPEGIELPCNEPVQM